MVVAHVTVEVFELPDLRHGTPRSNHATPTIQIRTPDIERKRKTFLTQKSQSSFTSLEGITPRSLQSSRGSSSSSSQLNSSRRRSSSNISYDDLSENSVPKSGSSKGSSRSYTSSSSDENNTSIISLRVPFTPENSAISRSFLSPRQQSRAGGQSVKDAWRSDVSPRSSRPLSGVSTASIAFDYDEFEDVQLEHVKHHTPHPTCFIDARQVYIRACHALGVTPCKKFIKQAGNYSRHIHMDNMILSDVTVKPLAIALVRDVNTLSLDLSGNDIGAEGVSYIAEALTENDTLEELNLSGTNLGSRGLEDLAEAMEHNNSLCTLRLESNNIEQTVTKFAVDIMKVSPCLTELYLGYNKLGYEGSNILAKELALAQAEKAKILPSNSLHTTLNSLTKKRLKRQIINHFVKSFHIVSRKKKPEVLEPERNTTLRILDLQWNHFRKDSAAAICNSLKHNSGLWSINLAWNGLGKEGCMALAGSLPENTSLRNLDLTNNRIDPVALPFLLNGLVRNTTLESLRLGKNSLTTEGVKAVIRAIDEANDTALKYLNIEDIPVDREFMALLRTLQETRSIFVEHGVQLYRAMGINIQKHEPYDLNRFDPMMVLVENMRIDNLRVIDLFKLFDTRNTGRLSLRDLGNGITNIGLPLNEHQLASIMRDIDVKEDRVIDLEEFMAAHRDMSRIVLQRMTVAKRRGSEDQGLKDLRKMLKTFVEKRKQRNKEKASRRFSRAIRRVSMMNATVKVMQPAETAMERKPTV